MTTTQTDVTAEKLIEMLQENTGRHMLDSGGAYGRHWEANQGTNFEEQPEGWLEFWIRGEDLDILPMVNVYHFLKDRLEYNPELDEHYREYVEEEDCYLDVHSAENFVSLLDGAGGIYGEGKPFTVNTYNGENLLSQVLQYVYWTDDNGAHVLLQIHGGCDVRGGYTDPVAFDVADYDSTSIFDNAAATIYCIGCGKPWDTDNGCHWAPESCYGRDYTQLNNYPATSERPDYPERPDPAQMSMAFGEFEDWEPRDSGVVWVDDEHNGHCPYCGGLLHISPWPTG